MPFEQPEKQEGFTLTKENAKLGLFVVTKDASLEGTNVQGGRPMGFGIREGQDIGIAAVTEEGVTLDSSTFLVNYFVTWDDLEAGHIQLRKRTSSDFAQESGPQGF
ncbi:MAG: hypothetical protein A2928_00020 [Candidatus Taylorbacteria bacterium RIFCSPLOWO2_01_FULL_45_15b]|uniref:Uncharacterized protein n=1 Tax=Candidatus Taylorbacteria bacterium RIFCSPLOWO2_01_FULL_45_15b TaxID=1802319 RepID=A0A1G2NCT3_9BACT|nr:MAG: hypothetical protein A2928_00020 [Candidatus Taylorbacteria bacterium RIFCSPLOWO2_01_FULL_45_15b]